ncbi:putative dihydroorotate dehydrogenase A (fumarate) [Neolecta irregularis DAH-3]|uniref:Dihydroorotate oxidase n=1 Tax=Neolecta irregularis (strain DAH-3) TaxID=1198029 RepID=A0A1U7LNJ4_NEOID|nr:putative dihydroorotate dehydrogenase A (fumarate) [Neolecta irregularis DAH-3]|eukprot:OLL24225.1 putative dihydroorotate dehydrogenase A (fumarate) [Neolecta irregularis DAH-3]
MARIGNLYISPPLLPSSSYFISTKQDFLAFYNTRYTGCITTRTCQLDGFLEDGERRRVEYTRDGSSINNFGYSPYPLRQCLSWIEEIEGEKPVIVSVAGGRTQDLLDCIEMIQETRMKLQSGESRFDIGIEVNTSCPNLGNVPAGFDFVQLAEYLTVIARYTANDPTLTVGLKLPPYTHDGHFDSLISVLERTCPIRFITSTNTLGNGQHPESRLVGGIGGSGVHYLALGNVYTLRARLNTAGLQHVKIIGVGGCFDNKSYQNFLNAGADAVGLATAIGVVGRDVFSKILEQ